jgi:hypothetical protein
VASGCIIVSAAQTYNFSIITESAMGKALLTLKNSHTILRFKKTL